MPSQTAPQDNATYDYIIIGAGSAGCTLANRLSADPSTRVLVLEAGGKDNWIWMKIPVGYLFCLGNPRADWGFHTASEPGLNGRALLYPRGRTLGGSSSINGMIYMRGQKRDYDEWAALSGDPTWAWDEVLPLFKDQEDHHAGPSELHGAGGQWRVENQRLSWEILDAFREAAGEAGIAPTSDFNRGDNFGAGRFEVNQRKGVRLSASTAFLKPVMHRANLEVRTHAQVRRLIIADGAVTGVDFLERGQPRQVTAAREVILAAGAVASPQILQLSGVGPGDLLARHQIPLLHALSGVGGNLQDHLQMRMGFRVKNVRTLNERSHSLLGKALMGLEYLLFRSGPLTMAPSQMGAFAKSGPEQETPNLEYHVQPLTLEKFGEPLHKFPAFTASVCNLRPTSRGHVHIQSPDFTAAPDIRPNYLSTPEDQQVAVEGIKLTRRIVAGPALAKYAPEEFMPGPQAASDDDLVKAAGDIGTTIFHPIGTCRMGDGPEAVVDSRLRLHGLRGLRVVDASIMPTITSGNTAAPTMMIAEKASRMILEDARTL